jgi:hypothetical protein
MTNIDSPKDILSDVLATLTSGSLVNCITLTIKHHQNSKLSKLCTMGTHHIINGSRSVNTSLKRLMGTELGMVDLNSLRRLTVEHIPMQVVA